MNILLTIKMEELFNLELELDLQIELYNSSLKYYKRFARGNRESLKIVISQTLCYILYKLYSNYLPMASYNDLYTTLYRKVAKLIKLHNRNERINNRKNNIIYVDIEDILFFILYICENNLFTSTMLFKYNLINILDIYYIDEK